MRKEAALLLLILSISLAVASPELSINKETFQPGETIIGTITGNFAQDIFVSNLMFYEGFRTTPIETDLTFYNGTYYFYAYPSKEGNFSLKVSNILYTDPEFKSANLEKNFQVKSSNSSFISIKPGFIVTSSDKEFSVSNKGNKSENITYTFENKTQNFTLKAGEYKKILLSPKKDFSFLSIKSNENFSIPVIYTPLISQNESVSKLSVSPSFLKVDIKENQSVFKELKIINKNKISFNVSISNSTLWNIGNYSNIVGANSNLSLNLSFAKQKQGYFNDSLVIQYSSENITQNISVPIDIFVFQENYTLPTNITNSSNQTNQTNTTPTITSCSSLGGQLCSGGQNCEGSASFASDGYCCIGKCYSIETKESGSYGWLVALLIFAILGAGGYFAYKKYKKTTPQKPEDAIKQKSELYEKRISGGLART